MDRTNFDGIIACGDSFTLGPVVRGAPVLVNTRAITMQYSWPMVLGQIMNLPVENVSRGGASNTEISLQPLLSKGKFNKPLIIFGFTTDNRYPYFSKSGKMFSVNGMRDEDFIWEDSMRSDQTLLAKDFMQRFLLPTKETGYTGMDHLFIESVNRAMAYENIIPNATVIWGDLHSEKIYEQHRTDGILSWLAVPARSRCFNDINSGKPLQTLSTTDDNSLQMSDDDMHPNENGLIKYAEAIHNFIISITK
tara:strand:- start:4922 stop:5671 length:750 start_codon:yes stop_codon:yes gene_type:complete